jgi:hypothetical protein
VNVVAKIEVIKMDESRVSGALPYNARLEMRLGEHDSGKSIAESGLESRCDPAQGASQNPSSKCTTRAEHRFMIP